MSPDHAWVAPIGSGMRDRLLAMRSVGLFQGLDEEGSALLAENSRIAEFQPGERVLGAGLVESLHIVLEGRLRVQRQDGTSLLLEAGQPAGLIGVLAYGLTGPMSHAEVPTRTLQVSRESFVAALEESFSLLRSVFRVVASTILDIRGNLPPVVDAPLQQSSRDTRPRTLVERAIEISMRGMFSQANIDAVFDLARILREVHVPATHVFWRRNDPAVMAVRVFSGVIRCTNEHGESALVSDDHTLGTMATFALRPHAYTAVAETDVSAYQMTSEEFLVILEAQPKLAMRLLASLAELLARAI